MIQIRIERDHQKQLQRIRVTGHAQFAEYGKDIVCAAVSGIVIGQVNAVEELTGVSVHQPDDGEGKIDCMVPKQVDSIVLGQIRLLLEAMVISLHQVAQQYPAYIQWVELR